MDNHRLIWKLAISDFCHTSVVCIMSGICNTAKCLCVNSLFFGFILLGSDRHFEDGGLSRRSLETCPPRVLQKLVTFFLIHSWPWSGQFAPPCITHHNNSSTNQCVSLNMNQNLQSHEPNFSLT